MYNDSILNRYGIIFTGYEGFEGCRTWVATNKPRGEGKGCFVEVAWMMDTPLALLKRVRAPERNDAKGRVIINFGLFR
ncbi:hypothetical protein A8M58_02020 [Yersinia pestis]|nr:hypothetical protein A8M58_02020 [Yersinia pestis]